MMDNIFQHGGQGQLKVISPYLSEINNYTPNQGDFFDYFFSLLDRIYAIRSEREEIEDWVVDIKEYIKNSEIMIAISLFESIDDVPGLASSLDVHPMQLSRDLFTKLCEYGLPRGWDTASLQVQFFRVMGMHPYNALAKFIVGSSGLKDTIELN